MGIPLFEWLFAGRIVPPSITVRRRRACRMCELLHTSVGDVGAEPTVTDKRRRKGNHVLADSHRLVRRPDHGRIAVHTADAPHHLPRGRNRRLLRRQVAVKKIPPPHHARAGRLLYGRDSARIDCPQPSGASPRFHSVDRHRLPRAHRGLAYDPEGRGMAGKAVRAHTHETGGQAVQRIRLRPRAGNRLRSMRRTGAHGDQRGGLDGESRR